MSGMENLDDFLVLEEGCEDFQVFHLERVDYGDLVVGCKLHQAKLGIIRLFSEELGIYRQDTR